MTCIGQSKFRASSEYVHLQCTHQPTHESSLRSLQVIAAQFIADFAGCHGFFENLLTNRLYGIIIVLNK